MKLKIKENRNPKTGKPITVISNIIHNPQVIEKLAKDLKSSCGAGGHIDGKTITIHGSHTSRIKKILEDKGFTVNI